MRRLVLMLGFLMLIAAPGAGLAQTCAISPDGATVRLIISNPHTRATTCSVDCTLRTSRGSEVSVSCSKTVPANAGNFEVCARTREDGALFDSVLSRSGACAGVSAKDDDEDEDSSDDDDDDDEDEDDKK
jgi:hypothetical protein